jgi:hypothetical protein
MDFSEYSFSLAYIALHTTGIRQFIIAHTSEILGGFANGFEDRDNFQKSGKV